MSTIVTKWDEYRGLVGSLQAAVEAGDETGFRELLDELVRLRAKNLFSELRRLAVDLHGALERFRTDSRLASLAEKEVPDARYRLDHVLKLTDEAAHKTMDMVEQSGPIAERTAQAAANLSVLWKRFRLQQLVGTELQAMLDRMSQFLEVTQIDTETIRRNLAEVMVAQGYQDLTGQIIRGVMTLVNELEITLRDLARLSAVGADKTDTSNPQRRAYGPSIPGIDEGPAVSGQQDVDSLLSGLGL